MAEDEGGTVAHAQPSPYGWGEDEGGTPSPRSALAPRSKVPGELRIPKGLPLGIPVYCWQFQCSAPNQRQDEQVAYIREEVHATVHERARQQMTTHREHSADGIAERPKCVPAKDPRRPARCA